MHGRLHENPPQPGRALRLLETIIQNGMQILRQIDGQRNELEELAAMIQVQTGVAVWL
jgi:hypothetical protein